MLCNNCDGEISYLMMSAGIIDAFRQRCCSHNRVGRRSTKPVLPNESSPLVLGAVRTLANMPIMRRPAFLAKRTFNRSARSGLLPYNTDLHRRWFERRKSSTPPRHPCNNTTPRCGCFVVFCSHNKSHSFLNFATLGSRRRLGGITGRQCFRQNRIFSILPLNAKLPAVRRVYPGVE
jgi:hypothetical protein